MGRYEMVGAKEEREKGADKRNLCGGNRMGGYRYRQGNEDKWKMARTNIEKFETRGKSATHKKRGG